MKTSYLLFILLLLIHSDFYSQNIPLGAEQYEEQGDLNNTDVMIDSLYYYKSTSVNLKAGEGIFLYMLARDFEPQIVTLDAAQQNWVNGNNDFFEDGAFISSIGITAKKDTSFYVIYSSTVEYDTGAFVFGMRKLNDIQMVYTNTMSFCDRLFYLLNHWQCNWGLIPLNGMYYENEYNKTTKNTLVEGNEGTFYYSGFTDYSEVLYSGYDSIIAGNKYNDLVEQITLCLEKDVWDIYQNNEFDEYNELTTILTDFVIKGGESKQAGFCFTLKLISTTSNLKTLILYFY